MSSKGKFDLEKQNLLDELDASRRSKDALEQANHLHEQDLRLLRDDKRASSEALKATQAKIHHLEQQVRRSPLNPHVESRHVELPLQLDKQLNQNKDLNDELHQVKAEATSLQRTVRDYQIISREKEHLQTAVVGLEVRLGHVFPASKSLLCD